MDVYLVIVLIVIFVFFIYRLNVPKIKGAKGESRVARQLQKLRDEQYKVFNDLLIRTDRGSSQIDHIVISIYGIFVIETKNYSGWIHGHENSEYWTQSIYEKKTKFRNPIRQNWAHIYALKKVLSNFKYVTYYPIIVFTGSAELKNISSKIPVIYAWQLIRVIEDESRMPNLSIEQVKNIAARLNEVNIHDKNLRKEHVYQVKNYVNERRRTEKSKVCPWCGIKLVVRDGQFGRFYGCPNFPKCRYKLSYRSR